MQLVKLAGIHMHTEYEVAPPISTSTIDEGDCWLKLARLFVR